jgi:hypothetical protein
MSLSLPKYLADVTGTTIFCYLALSSIIVMELNGVDSRINYFGFLIPHANKILLYSGFAILYLRRNFRWRFPFALGMVYAIAELLTNSIFYVVNAPETRIADGLIYTGTHYDSLLHVIGSNVFFILLIVLGFVVLKGQISWRLDWSMLPFAFFAASWVAMGYQTESMIIYPSYWLETQEFLWNLLYLVMMTQIFRVRQWIR